MNPSIQSEGDTYYPTIPSNAYFSASGDCPTEPNSRLKVDPNYSQQNESVFRTTLYSVYKDSGVYDLLFSLPNADHYTNLYDYLNFNLFAW